MTDVTAAKRPRGRPRKPREDKAAPRDAKASRGRPGLMLWDDPDRYAVAYLFSLEHACGISNHQAAMLAAFSLSSNACEPDDLAKLKALKKEMQVISFEIDAPMLDNPVRATATRLRNKAAARLAVSLCRRAMAQADGLVDRDGL